MKDKVFGGINRRNKTLKASLTFTSLYLLASLAVFLIAYKGVLPEYRWLVSVSAIIYASPHILLTVIGLSFNILGFTEKSQDFALAGIIMYALALFASPFNIFLVAIPMVMSIVALFQMEKDSGKEVLV